MLARAIAPAAIATVASVAWLVLAGFPGLPMILLLWRIIGLLLVILSLGISLLSLPLMVLLVLLSRFLLAVFARPGAEFLTTLFGLIRLGNWLSLAP